jgi:TolA-binding protein
MVRDLGVAPMNFFSKLSVLTLYRLIFLSLVVWFGAAFLSPSLGHAQTYGIEESDEPAPKVSGMPAAPIAWDAKKLERLDRNVRKLERAVQRTENKNAPPILIEPDPEVVALQATVSTLSLKQDEHTLAITRLTGQLEEATYKLARFEAALRRLELLEARVKDIDAILAPPPPPPVSTGTAENDFAQAFNLYSAGKIDDAGRAFEAFIQTWPESSQRPEAWFRLGQTRVLKLDVSGAVAAFATALKGWPKNAWAPEATVRLSASLLDTNRPKEACVALGEFSKRYSGFASSDMKLQARDLRNKAKCAV